MTAAPTSSASATPASTCRGRRPTAPSDPSQLVVDNFGFNAGGWRVDQHPRFLADTTGDGRADIVGFGNAGVYVSRAQADGTFGPVELLVTNFGYDAGGWRVPQHPRLLADTTGGGRQDIIGFGNDGVWLLPLVTAGPTFRGGGPGGPSPCHP